MLIKLSDKVTINIEEVTFVEISEDRPPASRIIFKNGLAIDLPPADTEKFTTYLDLTTLKVAEIYEKRDQIREEQARRKQLLESIKNQEEALLGIEGLTKNPGKVN